MFLLNIKIDKNLIDFFSHENKNYLKMAKLIYITSSLIYIFFDFLSKGLTWF